jgi:hypothetical protein
MTTDSKLTKVLEYLIKNDEEKARELLHQVFIEKARRIHEELMSDDEDLDENETLDEVSMDEMSMDEEVGGSGDQGKDLTNEIEAMEDEIDFEETMTEAGDEEEEFEVSVADDAASTDAAAEPAGDDMGGVDGAMSELESALAALKAEFEKLEAGEAGDSDSDGDDMADADDNKEMAEESWDIDEDFDDLAESLDLEVVEKDVLKTNKTAKDVGAASSGMTTGNDAKSPLPSSQTSRMGAKPVETGKGSTANGYHLEGAPKSADMGLGDNRRKKADDGMKAVPAPKNTDGASNKVSPLTKGGSNLK